MEKNETTATKKAAAEKTAAARASGTEQGSERDRELRAYIDRMPEGNTKLYIENRVIPQMSWYAKNSRKCKMWYQIWMRASIVTGAVIPVLSVLSFSDETVSDIVKLVIAALGSLVTVINALIALHNYKDLWTVYRMTREEMLQTLYFYFTNVGIFEGDDPQEKKDALLVKTLEGKITQESGNWASLMAK